MYILIENDEIKEYPYSLTRLSFTFPDVSFPEYPSNSLLEIHGVFPVKILEKPSFDNRLQKIVEGTPINNSGEWTQVWNVVDLSDEEIEQQVINESYRIRFERDQKLVQDIDSMNPIRWESMSQDEKDLWHNYRQSLLDITKQTGFPWNVEWPQKPGSISDVA